MPERAAGRIVIVGLGPGGHDHVTIETRTAIDAHRVRFARTAVHPSADLVPDAITFDHLYEGADRFDEVYDAIVEALVAAAAEHGEILYAVPGSPLVLERSVRALLDDPRVECDVRPAMSFLDVAYARLGIDPVETGVRLVDGHDFAVAAAGDHGPLLVAHVHADWVLSDIKLAIDDVAPGDASGAGLDDIPLDDIPVDDIPVDDIPVVVLQRLGTSDELITRTTWAELDRAVTADHLTSLYVPRISTPVGAAYVAFHQLARTLREQCPWDIEQTHHSLVPHLVEETYEVVDAVAGLDPDDPSTDLDLIEELGDLLYQIEFHATIAEQEGRFTIADVATGIHDKLVRRHPHVFGDPAPGDTDAGDTAPVDTAAGDTAPGDTAPGDTASAVLTRWEAIKRAEKGRTSIFDGIPTALPALAYARKVQSKAARTGFDWPDVDGALPKIVEEADEIRSVIHAGADPDALADEIGDLLFSVVNVARHVDVDPEVALRAAVGKFRTRFEAVERLAAERGIDLHADLATLDALWDEVKHHP